MFYDLNVPWNPNQKELQQRLSFLGQLGYNLVALSTLLPPKLPAILTSPISLPLEFETPANLRLLTRCTIPLTSAANNPNNIRLNEIRSLFDIVALRPTDEKTILQACTNMDCDLISIDLTIRYPFHFKHKMFAQALSRGIKLELCYSPGILSQEGEKRRNLLQNAASIIRSTRGRGIVISSEAASALGCRGPHDLVNLAVIWGLKQEMGREAVSDAARSVVAAAKLRQRSYRGAIDIIDGGTRPVPVEKPKQDKNQKRKAENTPERAMSKKAMKRAQRQSQEANASSSSNSAKPGEADAMVIDTTTELPIVDST